MHKIVTKKNLNLYSGIFKTTQKIFTMLIDKLAFVKYRDDSQINLSNLDLCHELQAQLSNDLIDMATWITKVIFDLK